jgi:hypothetical protein
MAGGSLWVLRLPPPLKLVDLQIPMQSVTINTEIVSSNAAHVEMYSIQHYVIKFVSDLWAGR